MMLRSEWLLAATLLSSVLAGACQPKIGDDCRVSTQCGSGSISRVCDTTQPDGYCTIYNCEPANCPSEAICVAFRVSPSAAPECSQTQGSNRLARSFCLRRCESNSDCRTGYVCMDMNRRDTPWQSAVLESAGTDGRACVPPYSGPSISSEVETGVCEGTYVAPPSDSELGIGGESAGGGGNGGMAGGESAGGESAGGESAGGESAGGESAGGESAGGVGGGGQAGSTGSGGAQPGP